MTDFTALGLPADLPDLSAPSLFLGEDKPPPASPALTPKQKAAVVVRVLLSNGDRLSLSDLPHAMQADLARTLGQLDGVDSATERKVVAEFLAELDSGGGKYGRGLEAALSMLDGSISQEVVKELGGARGASRADPWPRLAGFPTEKIAALLEKESAEVAAVVLSKLPGKKAAEVLAGISGPRARRAAFMVSRISAATPQAVRTIGRSLLQQLSDEPRRAFAADPAAMVGSMLLSARNRTREEILEGLKEEDEEFANRVRQEIFVFGDIPGRIGTTDIPKVLRGVDPAVLQNALKFSEAREGGEAAAAAFILDNMSKRMAESLREEMAEMPVPGDEAGEAAQAAVVDSIRELEAAGDLTLKPREKPAAEGE